MKPEIDLKDYETGFARFDSLMPFKVKDILLVSSLYDMYILREDGQIAHMVLSEYTEFNLSNAPTIKRVSSGEEALELLKERKFDLIIIFRSLGETDIASFSRKAKLSCPGIPVVLLAFHARELQMLEDKGGARAIDKAFIWSGESQIFLSIIKYIEDKKNVEFDTRLVRVRVIIVIEDSVRFYSAYLPLIYSEIMRQTAGLMSESLNMPNRLLRMRARPKILLASTYEEAWELFQKYKAYLLGIISDVSFLRGGEKDDKAGVHFIQEAKKEVEDLPVLLQSSDAGNIAIAEECQAAFLHKKSPTLLSGLGNFIKQNFGFGDFVFRDAANNEICRAVDFRSMEKCLITVPEESLVYHGNRNHFSNWLMARTEFDLAMRLRPRKVSEFKDIAEIRKYLIKTLKDFRRERQLGVVTDFSRRHFDSQAEFVRMGEGSLGGKGRGLAFINHLLNRYNVYDAFEGVTISVPHSAIIGTAFYDEFMEQNNLIEYALSDCTDEEIANAFIKAELPKNLEKDLRAYLDVVDYPLAVRSSSLLEDSHYQPFAGIFDTHMLPNCHHTRRGRLERLEAAVKLIYASIFFRNSKNYIEATGNRVEEEKMAVILQKVVGRDRNGNFYPTVSGIARSYNYYSIGHIKPEEGIAYVALGLGKTIMEGENCLFFSPAKPNVLPQFSKPEDYIKNAQKEFFAIDMNDPNVYPGPGGDMGLVKLPVSNAMEDGTLKHVGSTYSPDNDKIYTGVARKGVRIVTFDPILKARIFPLDEVIRFMLQLGANAMNVPVEVEFAAEISTSKSKSNEFHFLQIRPMALETALEDITVYDKDYDNIFCKSDQALSNGQISNIRDIIYVRTDNFDRSKMPTMVDEIGRFNLSFKESNIPYLLIGPGRWGTSDRWLGIPVKWRQISGARVIVEAAYGDFSVEPSFGTHFFQNLISFQIGYLTINNNDANNCIDWDWLNSFPPTDETEHVRHVRLEKPLDVLIDGRNGKAVIFKPRL